MSAIRRFTLILLLVLPFAGVSLRAQTVPAAGGLIPDVMLSSESPGGKSGFLGVLYSLAIPGMGELYAGRFDRGKYPFITEIALWTGALGMDAYGDWVRDDARIYAQRHAGIDPAGKDDGFWVNIENYRDIHDYNNQRLIERRTDDLYPDEAAWRWAWDSEESRSAYKDQRIHADEMHNAVTFFVLGMVANRVWSAIQAASAVRQHNASLGERLGTLPSMEPRLRSHAGRVDGIEFRFSW
ncbi:MAG: hypothetical protein RBU27_04285 [Bacteroidota bacterium]|jgi:hypothetical protein|nr:hypothetical protein [Bacteroidota bacterium]